jgi:hypothetical protein
MENSTRTLNPKDVPSTTQFGSVQLSSPRLSTPPFKPGATLTRAVLPVPKHVNERCAELRLRGVLHAILWLYWVASGCAVKLLSEGRRLACRWCSASSFCDKLYACGNLVTFPISPTIPPRRQIPTEADSTFYAALAEFLFLSDQYRQSLFHRVC